MNKKKVRGVMKYLVCWKEFTAENNIWEKKKDIKNMKELVKEFKRRIEAEVRRQEIVGKKNLEKM